MQKEQLYRDEKKVKSHNAETREEIGSMKKKDRKRHGDDKFKESYAKGADAGRQ